MKSSYVCTECGANAAKWAGQCLSCGEWNCVTEFKESAKADKRSPRAGGYAGTQSQVTPIGEIALVVDKKSTAGSKELDRVLGGGLVPGSVILIGGDPGIGKSTLLIQTLSFLSSTDEVLYVTGEESLQQVALRANRLELAPLRLKLFAETHVEMVIDTAKKEQPKALVIDSIQTIYSDALSAAPGSVSQVRESAAQLVRFAKASGVIIFLVGHVTKDGAIAGPRVLEHMVDTVLYFEGQTDSRFRVIRAMKNRFGAVNELGVFAMTEKGLKDVANPSAIFLSRGEEALPGSVVMVTWEGSRPILVEVQALVDTSHGGQPKRVVVGLEQNRLALLLAVLHRHGDIPTFDQDVFINVVGGVKVTETGIDLALLVAVLSSFKNLTLSKDLIVFGEVGLAGEIRPVQSGQERLQEAMKHGFTEAIVPFANMPKKAFPGIKVHAVKRLQEIIDILREV